MKQHYIDEKTGTSYTLQGDYYLPDSCTTRRRRIGLSAYGDSGICAISSNTVKCFTPICSQAVN